MATAFTALASTTLGSTATSITFSSISGSYRDLYLILTMVGGTMSQPLIKVNNDNSYSNYGGVVLRSNGSSVYSTNISGYNYGMTLSLYTSNSGSNDIFYDISFLDYATTDKVKPVLVRSNGAGSGVEMNASKWGNTAAITSLVLYDYNGFSFGAGTTATLYGVSA